jgi:guanylate cyclase
VSARFWESLEKRYRPSPGLTTLEDPSLASKVPVANGLVAMANAGILTVLLFAYSEPATAWVVLAVTVCYVAATTIYLKTGNAALYINIMVWSSLVQNVAVHVMLGGYVWSGGFLMWGILVSTSVALFLQPRVAIAITSFYMVAAVILIFLEAPIRASRTEPNPTLSALLAFDVILISLIVIVPVVMLLLGQLRTERDRSESLLRNVLPDSIAERLKTSPGLIAEGYDSCTVLFADLVGFTDHARNVTPQRLIEELNEVFSRFDSLVGEFGAEKIKTMGDGYLAVSGAPERRQGHELVMCGLALGMLNAIGDVNEAMGTTFALRIGLATGSLVAGVVGTARFTYDLWGDTVNLASRMQTLADPDSIRATADLAGAAGDGFQFVDGGTCVVHGVGEVDTRILVGRS